MGATGGLIGTGFTRGAAMGRRALEGLDRTMSFAERRAASFARTVRTSLMFGGLGLSAVLTGGAAAGFRFNAQMEQNITAFENFTGSAASARKEVAFLVDLAKRTPFETTSIATAARRMMAFGFTTSETNKHLVTLADTVSATGASTEQMDRVVLAIGQIKAAGRLQGDELRQLMEAGIPTAQILRDELGLTQEQIADIAEENIPAQRVIDALMRGMNRLYGGASARQAQTFFGRWSTFRDTVKQTLGAITRDAFDASKGWLRSMTGFAEQVQGIWQGPGSVSDKAGRSWEAITDGFTEWLNGSGIETIQAGARKLGEVLAGAVNAIFGIGGGGGEQSPFYRAGKTAITSFAQGFRDQLKTGEIITSPLGKVLTAYFAVKFRRQLIGALGLGGGGRGGRGGGAADAVVGRGSAANPMYVVVMNPGGVPGAPGGPTPVPTGGPGGPGGGRGGRFGRAGRIARGVGRVAGRVALPVTLGLTAYDLSQGRLPNPVRDANEVADALGLRNSRARQAERVEALRGRLASGRETMLRRRRGLWVDDEQRADALTGEGAFTRGLNQARRAPAGISIDAIRAAGRDNAKASRRATFDTYAEVGKEAARQKPKLERTNRLIGTNFATAFGAPPVRARASSMGRAVIAAAVNGALTEASAALSAASGGAALGGVAHVAGIAAGATNPNLPGIGDGPGQRGGGTTGGRSGVRGGGNVYGAGQAFGAALSNTFNAGMASAMSINPTGGGAGAAGFTPGGGGTGGGLGGNWGGSQPLAEGLAALSGLPVSSRKRPTKFTASGGISDHWIGSTDAYAVDLSTTPPAGDAVAQRLGAAIGVPGYQGGNWLNVNRGGYRYQLGWRTPGHFDHIHLGVNKLHGGGTFRAPSPGGEGLAVLRDRERVVPASGNPRSAPLRSGPAISIANVNVYGAPSMTPNELMGAMASELGRVADNISTVSPDG